MRTGQSRKRDENEPEIIEALRRVGVLVLPISGEDVPDLLCFHARTGWQPAEVKSGKGQLTPGQADLQRRAPFPVFRTVADALQFFGYFLQG